MLKCTVCEKQGSKLYTEDVNDLAQKYPLAKALRSPKIFCSKFCQKIWYSPGTCISIVNQNIESIPLSPTQTSDKYREFKTLDGKTVKIINQILPYRVEYPQSLPFTLYAILQPISIQYNYSKKQAIQYLSLRPFSVLRSIRDAARFFTLSTVETLIEEMLNADIMLSTEDGTWIRTQKKKLELSEMLSGLFQVACETDDADCKELKIPRVTGQQLLNVVEYINLHAQFIDQNKSAENVKLEMEIADKRYMDKLKSKDYVSILNAADYLIIEGLIALCLSKLKEFGRIDFEYDPQEKLDFVIFTPREMKRLSREHGTFIISDDYLEDILLNGSLDIEESLPTMLLSSQQIRHVFLSNTKILTSILDKFATLTFWSYNTYNEHLNMFACWLPMLIYYSLYVNSSIFTIEWVIEKFFRNAVPFFVRSMQINPRNLKELCIEVISMDWPLSLRKNLLLKDMYNSRLSPVYGKLLLEKEIQPEMRESLKRIMDTFKRLN